MTYTLGYLAEFSGAELIGDESAVVDGVDVLQSARVGKLTFLSSRDYVKYLPETKATVVILHRDHLAKCPTNALVCDNPYLAYARISHLFCKNIYPAGIHPTAVVDPSAKIAHSVHVGPHCIVGANVEMGDECQLLGNNTICADVVMGDRCIVHPGAVVGSDGFGLANDDGVWVKIAQLGTVRIGNDVEIGANTTIDRGAIGDTIIEDGVKLDNMVQISHNVEIGAHSALAGCSGIAGSGKVGKRCILGGGAGVQGHLELGDDVVISGMTKVTRSLADSGAYTGGVPAMPHREWQKNVARFKRLDELTKKVKLMQAQIMEITDNIADKD